MSFLRSEETDFTRHRKTGPGLCLAQIYSCGAKAQQSEVEAVYAHDPEGRQPATAVGFFNARMKVNPRGLKMIHESFVSAVEEFLGDRLKTFNGFRLLCVDGSDVEVRSDVLHPILSVRQKGKGKPKDMPMMMKLSAVCDALNKHCLRVTIGRGKCSEREQALQLLCAIPEKSQENAIVIFDRGYFSFILYMLLSNMGYRVVFRVRSSIMMGSFEKLSDGKSEFVKEPINPQLLKQMQSFKALSGSLPEDGLFRARIIQFCIGKNTFRLVTNLSSSEASDDDLKTIYRKRWAVETAFDEVKNKLRMGEFSGKRERLIIQDMIAAFTVHAVTRLTMAAESGSVPTEKKHPMQQNFNRCVGAVKRNLAEILLSLNRKAVDKAVKSVREVALKEFCPVRPDRLRKKGKHKKKNRSAMVYRPHY